jgi:transglutaminase-like putative cysteine protease
MTPYLAASRFIDFTHPDVSRKAAELAEGCDTDEAVTNSCFEFVRDHIKHSGDFQLNPVTIAASDVLLHRTGYCYAKSHLLAALLRANRIPAALCYQRLSVTTDPPKFCLHGLNAVCLKEHGWYRIDARGNKPGIDARFSPPQERLAFPIVSGPDLDLPELWHEPLPVVIQTLTVYSSVEQVANNLPDIEVIRLT